MKNFFQNYQRKPIIMFLICIIMLSPLPSTYAVHKSYVRKHHHPKPLILSHTTGSVEFPRISEYHGLAYDMFSGNPKGETVDLGFQAKAVFELTYEKQLKTGDDLFFVPDQVTVVGDLSCSLASTATTYFGMNSYQSDLRVAVAATGGYDGWGISAAFSASAEYNEMKSSMQEEEKVAVIAEARCLLYHSQLMETASLSQDFKDAIARAFRTKSFNKVIEQWGTHFAHEVEFGATAIQRSLFTRTAVEELESMSIDVGIAASFSGWGVDAGLTANVGYSKEQQAKFDSTTREVKESYIGLAPPESGDAKEWLSNIKSSHPVPVGFKLTPLIDLFTKNYFGATYSTEELNAIKSLYNAAVRAKAASLNLVGPSDNLIDFQKIIRFSDSFGTAITASATGYFKDTVYDKSTIKTKCINGRGSTVLEMIQLTVNDETNTYTQPTHGSGAATSSFCYPNTKWIDYLVISADSSKVIGIEFYLSDGTKSVRFGGSGGTETRIDIKGHIVAFEGMADTTVKALRIISRNTQYLMIPGFSQIKTTKAGFDNGISFRDLDRPLPEFRTKKINIWIRDQKIEGIQAVLTTPASSEETPAEINGMSYGILSTYDVPPGKYMKTVNVWTDTEYVKGIQFVLNDNTQSPVYGVTSGTDVTSKSFTILGHVTGFYGYHTRFLRSLGVMYVLNL